MAFTFSVNNVHSPQQALYELKERLKTAGWAVLGSGDGSGGSFSNVADILTTYSTVADAVPGAVTNRRAWWRMRDPSGPGGRELLFQHGAFNTATDDISVAYSRSAGFTGTGDGAVAADVAPTATDAWIAVGERRPSLNLSGDSFSGGNVITRVDYIIGDASEGYSFACYLRNSSGAVVGGLFYERVVNPHPSDTDPYMVWSPGCYSSLLTGVSGALWDHRTAWTYGDAGVGVVSVILQSNHGPWGRPAHQAPRVDAAQKHSILRPGYWGGSKVHDPGGNNPFDNDIDIVEPAFWYSTNLVPASGSPPFGNPSGIGLIKGESRFIKGISSASGFSNLDTNAALTRMGQVGGNWLLWDGVTTPLS
jgi:hypothetical protein